MAQQDGESIDTALAQYAQSKTMTDRLSAMTLLRNGAPEAAAAPRQDFYTRYSADMLVMTKYFSVIRNNFV